MATYQELIDAVRRADAAGDTQAAKRLAAMAVAARDQGQVGSPAQPPQPAQAVVEQPVAAQTAPGAASQTVATQAKPYIPKSPWIAAPNVANNPEMDEAIKNFVKEVGTEAGASAVGQAIGLAAGPAAFILAPTFGGIGGLSGNIVNQYTRKREGDFKVNVGEAVSAFLGGAIPGGSSIKFGGRAITKKIAPIVTDAGAAIVAAEAQSVIDNGRILSPEEAAKVITTSIVGSKIAKSLHDQSVATSVIAERQLNNKIERDSSTAVQRGWSLWPSVSKKSPSRYYFEKVADPHKATYELAAKNLDVIDKAVRDDLEMYARQADGSLLPLPINKESVNIKRQDYENEFSRIGELTKTTDEIMEIRGNRRRAASLFAQAEAATDTVAKDKLFAEALSFSEKAKALEGIVDEASKLFGKDTYDRFVKTRKMFAKSFAVEDSLASGGFREGINPQKLSRWQNKKFGQELTDDLGFVAKMADNFGDIVIGPDKLYSLERSLPKRTEGFTRMATSIPSFALRQIAGSQPVQRYFSGEQLRMMNPGISSLLSTQAPRAVGSYIAAQGNQSNQ